MSEELIQKNLTEKGQSIGYYEYYNIGRTSLRSLKSYNIIQNQNYGDYEDIQPDGLIVDRRNINNIKTVVVIEYKKPEEFNTNKKRKMALEQCNTYCEVLGAKIGICTDGNNFIWINPQIKTEKAKYKYFDDEDIERGYDLILDEHGNPLIKTVDFSSKKGIKDFLTLLEKIISSIDNENSQINKVNTKNPKVLAKQVWQSVWLATGDDPKKCLMTFTELFIFKFLSDLGVLKQNRNGVDIDFDTVIGRGKDLCLKYYLNNVRTHIKEMFPVSEDGTTIINGLSLREDQNQDELFFAILNNFKKFGDLKNIDPEFKSRLFEEFLKGTTGKKQLAQFFTPRNVIKAIVKMAKVESLPEGSSVADPASGVGGFILETMIRRALNNKNDFKFTDDGKLVSRIEYNGFDFDESTIILAKASIIIFLSDLLKKHEEQTEKFADLVNKIFIACSSSIVGSLEKKNPNKYDLIMSNPPYVTKGLSLYKNYISKNSSLNNYYTISSQGKEGLFIEKMVRELAPNGRAFIIVPDGFLYRPADKELRRFILEQCYLDGIISLPVKTFYTTSKKTYIIALTKKEDPQVVQTDPVFTYIVSNIGETLDVNRLPTDLNDLDDMATQFLYFVSNKSGFHPMNNRCKIQDLSKFDPSSSWIIDEWWTHDEKVLLGIEEEKEEFTNEIIFSKFKNIKDYINQFEDKLKAIFETQPEDLQYFTTTFGNEDLFEIYTSTLSYTKRTYSQLDIGKGRGIPIYTATKDPVAYIKEVEIKEPYRASASQPHISVASDGDGTAGTNIVYHTSDYYLNTSRLAFKILDEGINPLYVYYYIQDIKKKYGFDYRYKCNLTNFKNVEIKIPIDSYGNFDLKAQQEYIEKYEEFMSLEREIKETLFADFEKLEENVFEHLLDFFKSIMNLKK